MFFEYPQAGKRGQPIAFLHQPIQLSAKGHVG